MNAQFKPLCTVDFQDTLSTKGKGVTYALITKFKTNRYLSYQSVKRIQN